MSKTTKLRNIHPGEVLREEFLIPLGVTQYRLAKEIGVTEARISAICSGKRAITADTALRLAAFFGTSSGFWLGLQADYDTEEAAKELTGVLRRFIALSRWRLEMKAPVSHLQDPDLQKAPQALMRASEKARQLAEQTGTSFGVRKSVAAEKRK